MARYEDGYIPLNNLDEAHFDETILPSEQHGIAETLRTTFNPFDEVLAANVYADTFTQPVDGDPLRQPGFLSERAVVQAAIEQMLGVVTSRQREAILSHLGLFGQEEVAFEEVTRRGNRRQTAKDLFNRGIETLAGIPNADKVLRAEVSLDEVAMERITPSRHYSGPEVPISSDIRRVLMGDGGRTGLIPALKQDGYVQKQWAPYVGHELKNIQDMIAGRRKIDSESAKNIIDGLAHFAKEKYMGLSLAEILPEYSEELQKIQQYLDEQEPR